MIEIKSSYTGSGSITFDNISFIRTGNRATVGDADVYNYASGATSLDVIFNECSSSIASDTASYFYRSGSTIQPGTTTFTNCTIDTLCNCLYIRSTSVIVEDGCDFTSTNLSGIYFQAQATHDLSISASALTGSATALYFLSGNNLTIDNSTMVAATDYAFRVTNANDVSVHSLH